MANQTRGLLKYFYRQDSGTIWIATIWAVTAWIGASSIDLFALKIEDTKAPQILLAKKMWPFLDTISSKQPVGNLKASSLATTFCQPYHRCPRPRPTPFQSWGAKQTIKSEVLSGFSQEKPAGRHAG